MSCIIISLFSLMLSSSFLDHQGEPAKVILFELWMTGMSLTTPPAAQDASSEDIICLLGIPLHEGTLTYILKLPNQSHQYDTRTRIKRICNETKESPAKMYCLQSILFIVFITRMSSTPLHHCHHQTLPQESSSWREFLQSGIFSPTTSTQSHHLQRLRHKIAELGKSKI